MIIIKAGFSIVTLIDAEKMLGFIELFGRTCYKSDSPLTFESSKSFTAKLITNGHESVLEHLSISVRIFCDRGISHELVRHRIASYSQESTRYCNYSKSGIMYIKPCFLPDCPEGLFTSRTYLERKFSDRTSCWLRSMLQSEIDYNYMISDGMAPQEARSVLPNSLKTEINVTMNLREWRHFFKLRAAGIAGKPHPQMLEITVPMLRKFKELLPVVFDDIIVPYIR